MRKNNHVAHNCYAVQSGNSNQISHNSTHSLDFLIILLFCFHDERYCNGDLISSASVARTQFFRFRWKHFIFYVRNKFHFSAVAVAILISVAYIHLAIECPAILEHSFRSGINISN